MASMRVQEGDAEPSRNTGCSWWLIFLLGYSCAGGGRSSSDDASPAHRAPTAGEMDALAHGANWSEATKRDANSDSSDDAAVITTRVRTTVERLLDAYRRDPVAAERRFAGREVQITGTVASRASDASGHPFLVLRSQPAEDAPRVTVDFSRSEAGDLDSALPGRAVEINGRCEGESGGTIVIKLARLATPGVAPRPRPTRVR